MLGMKNINLEDKNNKLFYIGGVVRDELLNKKSFDIDLTYVGNAIEFAKNCKGLHIKKINEPFGTVRVLIGKEEVDIASTRKEIYERAGHLPTVTEIGCPLKDDVLRRDFTINAMAKNYNTSEIIDYTGGLDDIKNKIIRVLHDKSFIEDPTRIIRALKFAVRFNFTLDKHTEELRDNYLKNINYDMSYKRVKKELIETFNLNSQKAYDEFIDKNIYKLVTKNTINKPVKNIEQIINKYKSEINNKNIWLIYVGTLEDLSNLELTKEEQCILKNYNYVKDKDLKTDFDIYKAFENCPVESVLLYGILVNDTISTKYLDLLKQIKISINGESLKKLGIKPSEKYQECFDFILKEKLNNPQISTQEEIKLAGLFFGL